MAVKSNQQNSQKGLPGLRRMITSYLHKPKADGENIGDIASKRVKAGTSNQLDLESEVSATAVSNNDDLQSVSGSGMTPPTVESSDGLLTADASLDRDVDLEALVQNLGTEWADCLESEFEQVDMDMDN